MENLQTVHTNIWFIESTPWYFESDLEPVSESWIFQNFETRDPENRFFHKFKKSLSGVFSLKWMKKIQNFQKNDFFVFLIDFRVRSPGHSR